MTQIERGHVIRAAILRVLEPRLCVGAYVPPASALARALGVSKPMAWRHLRRALDQGGIEVEREPGKRLVVVGLRPIDCGNAA